MKNDNVVLATGGWINSVKKPCPDNPKGQHFFKDVSRKNGKEKGEYLITSKCKHCGGLIVDCPMIYI